MKQKKTCNLGKVQDKTDINYHGELNTKQYTWFILRSHSHFIPNYLATKKAHQMMSFLR